eukprot:1967435-Amphidinium_carterae.1
MPMATLHPTAMPYMVLPQAYAAPQPAPTQQVLSAEHFTHLVAMVQRLHTDLSESTRQLQRQQQILAQGLIDIRSHMDMQFQVLSAQ